MSKQQEIVQKLVASMMEAGADINALTAAGVDVQNTVMTAVAAAIRETVPLETIGALYQAYVGAIKQVAEERPVERAIRKALAASVSLIPNQTPAIEAVLIIRHVPMTLNGALSESPDGGLRLLTKGDQHLVEHFFGWGDVVVFALVRQVSSEVLPRLFRG